MKKQQDNKILSRRQVVFGTGAMVAGAALMTQFGGLLGTAQAQGRSSEKWPWPYEKLDPAKSAEIAYHEWYRVFCGSTVINSVFGQLSDKIGEPYSSFPSDAFVFLEGGQVGWGTTCGSPAAANIVANLIIGPRIAGTPVAHMIVKDIMEWYSEAELPTYVPLNPKVKGNPMTTVSDSPLCHQSLGRWMDATGYALKTPERKDRCARVAASTTYRLVELLNDWKDGKYELSSDFSATKEFGIPSQANCMDCHGSAVPKAPRKKKKA